MPEKPAYKRLETDVEFRDRIYAMLGGKAVYWRYDLDGAAGGRLDEIVLAMWQKQRKIVEVFP